MIQLENGEYWFYLRKSRADVEAEARGEGETLSKHRNALFKLAKSYNVTITEVFEEIVSGESLIHRPQMLKMLEQLEIKKPKGIFVMDLDRLGRGNMQEQGLILEAFRESNTKIITPRKIYDLNNEFDEEYSEFEAFMARKELKIINRRLQGGRIRSVEEGNYIGTNAPFGYEIAYDDKKGRYLVPHKEKSLVVKMIFDLYTNPDPEKRMGSSKIARRLNEMTIKSPTGRTWDPSSVLSILKNEVYIGRIQWKKKKIKKSTEIGKKKEVETRAREDWIDVKGKHEPIVSEDVFNKAKEILKGKYHIPYHLENGKPKISAPLAGLIKCEFCGATLVYRPYTKQAAHIRCPSTSCINKSTRYAFVEQSVIESLEEWLEGLKIEVNTKDTKNKITKDLELKKNVLQGLERELKELENQKNKLFDLLERGVYSEELFVERSSNIQERIAKTEQSINSINKEIQNDKQNEKIKQNIIPTVESVVNLYKLTNDPIKKNALLKSVISEAIYKKEQHQKGKQFSLIIKTKL